MRHRKKHEVAVVTQSFSERFFYSLIATLVLFVQVALPLAPAFANEETAPPASEDSQISQTQTETLSVPVEEVQEESVVEIETLPEDDLVPIEEDNVVLEENTSIPEQLLSDGPETEVSDSEQNEETTDLAESSEPETSASSTDTEVDETTDIDQSPPPEQGETEIPVPTDTEEDEENEEVAEEQIDTSTSTETTVVAGEYHTVTNDDNRMSFGIDDCARVADGSFYCRTEEEVVEPEHTNRVFAGPDAEGDNEIFVELDGEVTQVSNNVVDDGAPFYDEESNTIVWHRLIDARYQIVSYDVETGAEEVLTNDHYNNMQPSRAGDLTVWQGWVGNDWEILLKDGSAISMLTDNTTHDIGPQLNGDYVIWQAEEIEGWKVRVYNRLSGQTETIADADGASIENPRFVLLYDAKQENGDVETRGYDLKSGRNIPLGSQSGDVPEVPDPDQTGEDRALLSGSAQLKTKTEEEIDPEDDDTIVSTTTPAVLTPESSDEGDLVVPPLSDIETPDPVGDTGTTSVDYPEDLVIEPLPIPETIPPVEDLVIPPFTEDAPPELDSQDPVATSS